MDLITPRVIPLLTYLLYDNRLTAPLLRSFLRLFAVAWKHDFQHTDPLPFEPHLMQIIGVCPSQARRHIQQLRRTGLLDWYIDDNQHYVIKFLFPDDSQKALKRLSAFPESDDGVNSLNNININIKSIQHQHTQEQNALKRFSRITDPINAPSPNPNLALAPDASPIGSEGSGKLNVPHTFSEISGKFTTPCIASDDTRVPSLFAPNAVSDDAATPTESALVASQNHLQTFVLDCLSRAGVWSDVALQIRDQVLANQLAADPHKPNVADVLGWMAYCFGGQHKNGINAPSAVLARNLQSGRRCPENLRPQPICARCHYQHSHCICDQPPQDYFPPDFIEAAFKEQHYDYNTDRWGVCKTCRAFPCQCEDSDDE
jgi:hypothetical protein